MTSQPGSLVPVPPPPPPPLQAGRWMGRDPPSRGGFGSTNHRGTEPTLFLSITFEPNWARCWSVHRATAKQIPVEIHPPSWAGVYLGGRQVQGSQGTLEGWGKTQSRARSLEKLRGMGCCLQAPVSLPRAAALPGPAPGAERRGLRCSVAGAAFAGGRAEPLISLSAPDTIARQHLPIHLQFYP